MWMELGDVHVNVFKALCHVPRLRKEVELGHGQGTPSPHSTMTRHGTLRNSGILYLNLAFHIVMKVYFSI